MSARAQALAKQFEQVNAAAISAVEACNETAWRAVCRDEGWPVAFTAWHIGNGHMTIMGLVTVVANGQQLPPITPNMLNAMNADNATQHATCSRQEALDLLRQQGTAVADAIRQLSDEQLDRSAVVALLGEAPLSVHQLIEAVLIGHARQHLASIEASVQAPA